MARKCELCSKRPGSGNLISHSHIKSRTRWLPNIKKVANFKDGVTSRIYACARCIKSGFITKPPRRTYRAPQTNA